MKVIVGIDGGEQQLAALTLGAQLAAGPGDELVVAHAYEWSLMSDRVDAGHARQVREHADALVQSAAASLGDTPCTTRVVADLSIPRALHALAEDEHADVLVLGSCHRGPVGRTLLGGVGERVIHGAPCRIAVAPRGLAPHEGGMRRIGVAFDGSPESYEALGWAAQRAEAVGASLVLLMVYVPLWVPAAVPGSVTSGYDDIERQQREQAQQVLHAAVESLPAALEADSRLLNGSIARALAHEGEDLDLLVLGSRGYGPVKTVLLGAVTHRLVRSAPCPLMILPRGTGDAGAPGHAGAAAAGSGG
jgi:nucleotide-binding universal stress UspA family protein